jgi:hypothetical protein
MIRPAWLVRSLDRGCQALALGLSQALVHA